MKIGMSDQEHILEALAHLGAVQPKDAAFASALGQVTLQLAKFLSQVSHALPTEAAASAIQAAVAAPTPAPTDKLVRPDPAPSNVQSGDDDLLGASKTEAAILIIREKGHPCGPSEILEAFAAKGLHHLVSDNSIGSLTKAMIRRAKHSGDVIKLPGSHGKWDLTEHYSPGQLAILLSNEVITQEVAKDRQKQRTKEGMARARERGKTTGATFKITREQGIEFKRLVRDGVRTGDICDKFGISPGSVYNYKRRLADWDETSDVWPPPEKEEENPERPNLWLVSKTG